MEIQRIRMQWQALFAQYTQGLHPMEMMTGCKRLIWQLARIGTPEAERLSYQVRLGAVSAAIDLDPVKALPQFRSLLADQPIGAGDAQMARMLEVLMEDLIVKTINANPSPDQLEQLMALIPQATNDPDQQRHFRALAHSLRNDYDAVADLMDGYVPPLSALGAMEPDTWMARHYVALTAYLAQGEWDKADQVVRQAMDAGVITAVEPMGIVAESLSPLAQHVDSESSAARARFVLRESVADPAQLSSTIQAAIFLLQSGLTEEAFALVSATEPLIENTADAVQLLYLFFRNATDLGFGERLLVRFTSPRWQRVQGTGADPSCAALAQSFGRSVLADAARRDRANGNTYYTEFFTRRNHVPVLSPWQFEGTALEGLVAPGEQAVGFDSVDKQYAPELLAYGRALCGEPGAFPAGAFDGLDELREELQAVESYARAEEIVEGFARVAQDPGADPVTRRAMEIAVLEHIGPPVAHLAPVAARALPMLANINPAQAVLHTVMLLQELNLDTPLARDLFEFAGGLLQCEEMVHVAAFQLTLLADEAGRPMDAIAAAQADSRTSGQGPSSPDEATVDLSTVQMRNYARIGAPKMAAEVLLASSDPVDDPDGTLVKYALAVDVLLTEGEFAAAVPVFSSLIHLLEHDRGCAAWPRMLAAAAAARFISEADDISFAAMWPRELERLKRVVQEVVDGGEVPGSVAEQIGKISTALQHTQRLKESVQLTSWALPVIGRMRDPEETVYALCDNALALHLSQRFKEAALVLESVYERAEAAGVDEAKGWATAYLRDFATQDHAHTGVYTEALERILR